MRRLCNCYSHATSSNIATHCKRYANFLCGGGWWVPTPHGDEDHPDPFHIPSRWVPPNLT